jgi:hypothetical protein
MATEVAVQITDTNTSTKIPVIGVDVASSPSDPVGGHSIVQSFALRNPASNQYAAPDANGNLPVVSLDTVISGNITILNSNLLTGTPTAGSFVALTDIINGAGCVAIQISGTWTGTLTAQTTIDDTNWISFTKQLQDASTGLMAQNITSAQKGIWLVNIAAATSFRLTASAAMTGTAVVTMRLTNTVGLVSVDNALPAGAAIIGALTANQSTNQAQYGGATLGAATAAGTSGSGNIQPVQGVTNGVPQPVTGASSGTAVTGTWTTTGGSGVAVSASVGTAGNVSISLHGTYSGIVNFEASDDAGTTWYPIAGTRIDGGGSEATTSLLSNTLRCWIFGATSATNIRVWPVTSPAPTGTTSVRIIQGSWLVVPSVAATSTNDSRYTTAYSTATTVTIKATAGRLVSVLVTTIGSGTSIIYDNASAASGTIIGVVPGGTAVGTVLVFAAPAALGITIGTATTPCAFTVMWA